MTRRTIRRLGRSIGLLGHELGWWIGGAGRIWWRHKIAATLQVVLIALAWWQQQFVIVTALVAPVAIIAFWARLRPVSYRRFVGDPLARWRFLRWLRSEWPRLMESVGLARKTPTADRPTRTSQAADGGVELEVPVLTRARWRHGQLVAWPRLLTGQIVDDVESAADRLRVAVGAHRCRIVPDPSATSCRIVWSFGDPLTEPFDAHVPPADAPLGCLESVPLGRTEDSAVWRLRIGASTLVAGCSGSGKASLIWGLTFALGPASKTGLVELHGIDLKGGMELSMGRALFTRYAQTAEHAVALLEDNARNLQARAERLAGRTRQHTPGTDEPLVVIVIDELAALIAYTPDRDLVRRAEAALAVILSQGRAVGYRVFAFLQDPRKETVRMRHLFTQAIGLRLRDREEVTMVLGDGALRHGALCHKIDASTPGVGYVLGEDSHPVRVRAGYVSDDMIRTAAERFPARHQVPIILPADPEVPPRRHSTRSRTTSVSVASEGNV